MRMEKNEFEKTVRDYSDMLLRCAYSICSNRSDAEDIVQEAFIKLIKKNPKFRDEEHKKAWLLRVVINLSKDFVKSFWNRNKEHIEDLDDIKCIKVSKENDVTDTEIWSLVEKLQVKYRIVIELYYHEDLTLKEISAAIGKSVATTSNRLNRARDLLKKLYEEE